MFLILYIMGLLLKDAAVLTIFGGESELTHLQMKLWQGDKSIHSATVILCLHGIESHSGWFETFASETSAAGVDCLSYDRVGNGSNLNTHLQSVPSMLADLKSVTEGLRRQYQHIIVLGMSWGGLLAAYALQQGSMSSRYSILLVPGLFSLKSLPLKHLLQMAPKLIFSSRRDIPIPIEINDFSAVQKVRNMIREDALRRKGAPAHLLYETQKMRTRVRATKLPKEIVEVWLAEQDEIIDNNKLQIYLENQGVHFHIFKGHGHALIFECPEKLSRMMIERVRSLGLL